MPRVDLRVVLCFGLLTFLPVEALAQCANGKVLVGEDEKYWYCSDPAGFSPAAAQLVFALDHAARQVNPKKSLDPKTQDKNCSAFFRAVGKEIGATSREWKAGAQANKIIEMIRNDPAHWQRVDGDEAEVTRGVQARADRGQIVVGAREGAENGHLAIALPMPPDVKLGDFCCRGPMVRDGNVHLSQGKKKPSGWGAVRAGYAFDGYSDRPPEWYVWLGNR
jgi:hypothetical protein